MSLVETTKDARIFLKIGGAVAICAVLIFLLFKGGQFAQSTFFPKPPPVADEMFGELPQVEFPVSRVPVPEFTIKTISGFLPTFPMIIPVYEFLVNEPTITALPDARIRAKNLGFNSNEQAITPSEYRWTKPNGVSSLVYEIYNLNFSITPDYSGIINPFLMGRTTKGQIEGSVTSLITTLGGNLSDITISDAKYSYYNLTPEGIIPVEDSNNATLTRIDLFQNPVNKLKIYYPSANNSLLFFTLVNTNSGLEVAEANYYHIIPNLTKFATYNLKTAQEAYDDLKKGKGYIAQPTSDNNVRIIEIELGYYISDSGSQKYLQPIVVFKGANKFQAYVSALKD